MRDFLGECNAQGEPLVDFQATWCAFCLQPECSRSMAGKSLFDRRVRTWEERLFTAVPRMNPNDERYPHIAAKRFVGVPGSEERTPEVGSGWVDPMRPDESDEKGPDTQRDPVPEFIPEGDVTEPAPPPRFQAKPNQGRVLAGAPTKQAQADPWEPRKASTSTNDVVVPAGGRVRLGQPGVDPK